MFVFFSKCGILENIIWYEMEKMNVREDYFRRKEDISDPIERLYWELYEEGEDQ